MRVKKYDKVRFDTKQTQPKETSSSTTTATINKNNNNKYISVINDPISTKL